MNFVYELINWKIFIGKIVYETKKQAILDLLNTNGTMTQGTIAEAIYGDISHGSNLDTVLKEYLPRYFSDETRGQI